MPGTTDLVDVCTITIERTGRPAVRCEDIGQFDCTQTQESRPAYTLRRDRTARGFRHGARTIAGTMEITLPVGTLEIDLEEMMRTKERFNAMVQRGLGPTAKRRTLVNALITEVNETANGEGEHTYRCSFVAADYRPDPEGL